MRSNLFPWFSGLAIALVGGLLLSLPFAFAVKFVIACLMVFLIDSFGGRWFGYLSVFLLLTGTMNDKNHEWTTMLPIMIGSAVAGLIVRHSERSWFGVLLAMIAFTLPAIVLQNIQPRLDPALRVPLGSKYIILHVLASFAILISSLITWRQLASGQVIHENRVG